jgi:hypothetical protein
VDDPGLRKAIATEDSGHGFGSVTTCNTDRLCIGMVGADGLEPPTLSV